MTIYKLLGIAALIVVSAATMLAADISGTWTAKFDTQVGEQSYTYTFKVTGTTLTGHAKSNLGEGDLTAGKVTGDTVTFVENLNFQGMALMITYTGKIVSDDEIRFTRTIMDLGNEDLVAKRSK